MVPEARWRALAEQHLSAGRPYGWFEPAYVAAVAGGQRLPWQESAAHPWLAAWLERPVHVPPGPRALVVGCGVGEDVTPLLARGYQVTALDIAPARFVLPTGGDALLLGVLGVLGTVAHLLMTWSLRFAPASTLAPMQYLEIPFATLFGWLLFRDLPDGMAAAGIVVTVTSGLYIVLRERATPAPAPPAP